ncbi:MAG: PAS domain S-box protein, partial [bacterium]|nr:PAS domain S-box protein [bacterium]
MGIVAKIDMAEIREPFLRALGLACLVGTGLIAMGGFLFFRITDPLINAINASEARFRGTFNQAAVGISHVAPNGSWLEVNQKLCDIVGYTGDELLARTFQDITHPDDLDADLKFVRQVLAGERETYSMEKRYFHRCGDIVWINLTVSLVRDEHRAPDYFISVIEDISDRKQAEDALREREQFISRALNASLTGIYIYNLEKGHNDYINSRYTSLTGYCLDDICIMTPEQFAGLFHPEDRERIFAHREKVVQAEDDDVVEIEYQFRTRDGRWIWCLSWDSVFDRNEEGKVRRIIGTFLDLTERKRAEDALRVNEEQLQLILASTGEGIFGLNMSGCCTFANRACVEMLGFAKVDDLLGKKMHELIHHTRHDGTNYPVEECPTYRSCTQRHVTFADDELLWRADGSAFHAEYQSYPMLRNDSVIGAVVSFADITERKRAEAALKQERDFAESLIETAPVIVLVLDPEGHIIRFNSFMEELSGYSLAEVKGQSWFDTFLVERDVPQVADLFTEA